MTRRRRLSATREIARHPARSCGPVPYEPPGVGIRRHMWRWFSIHADARLIPVLRARLHTVLFYLHAENHDFETNGEGFVLDCLADEARTIVDVGANRGEWAFEAARRCPYATIHCFELASTTREGLLRRARDEPRIRVETAGLWSRATSISVKYYPTEPAWTSIHNYPHDKPSVWVEEHVTTGDTFISDAALNKIDFLKIDVEGSELAVLQGFRSALERRAIRVIQFEYGYAAVVSHGLLADFYSLLEPLGYMVGRLRRDAVEFAPYNFASENFFGPNFIAVRSDEEKIVGRLAERRPYRTRRCRSANSNKRRWFFSPWRGSISRALSARWIRA
jgi:FkbM family methyltransferase